MGGWMDGWVDGMAGWMSSDEQSQKGGCEGDRLTGQPCQLDRRDRDRTQRQELIGIFIDKQGDKEARQR